MASWTCGLACKTALPVATVEAWLEENCKSNWSVRLADVDGVPGALNKKIEVLFEDREDMDTFKAGFKSFEAQKIRDVA